jgi:cellobiose phosphorylase
MRKRDTSPNRSTTATPVNTVPIGLRSVAGNGPNRMSAPVDMCLLSNGHYSVLLTAAGSGYSVVDGIDVTRWREDAVCDCWGQYYYIRDLDDGRVWSIGRQPCGKSADEYQAELRPHQAKIRRRDGEIETCCQVAVVPDARAEIRRITLANYGNRSRNLEVTSYMEVALNSRLADQAHPAFAKLFLETEVVPASTALLCRRRPRAPEEKPMWVLHVMAQDKETFVGDGEIQFETDRSRFLGRGRTVANPVVLETTGNLSGTTGPVLDPIFSLRKRIRLGSGISTELAFTTASPLDRTEGLALMTRFTDLKAVNRVFDEAASLAQTELDAMDLSLQDATIFQRLAAHVVFTTPFLRSGNSVAENKLGKEGLWPLSISGDFPIVLLRINGEAGLQMTRNILKAHRYWRYGGLLVDLVILNDASEELGAELGALAQSGPTASLVDKPGGIFVRQAAALSKEAVILLEAASRVTLRDKDGALANQLFRHGITLAAGDSIPLKTTPGSSKPRKTSSAKPVIADASVTANEALLFENGLGGFTADGREYVITLRGGERPPAPWSNVLANPEFGSVVTEGGGGYTWACNSQMNRLTPWSNDPVSDPPAEIVYLRDEETGEFWTITPSPCGGETTCIVRHGQGYSRFTRNSSGLEQDLLLLVPTDTPVKLFHLCVTNRSNRPRRLSATFYCEWVLGTQRDFAPLNVVGMPDTESGILFATSAWAGEFSGRVAFAEVSRRPRSFTTDRTEFLGREGTTAAPAALTRKRLSDCAQELADPCAAIMTHLELPAGGTDEVVFLLGQAENAHEARRLAATYASPKRVRTALAEVKELWDRILGAVNVRTPDPALDLMLNRWLLYQTLASRMWARSGFYQSGGAFGFRDQLQDAMAVVFGAPHEARAQILRAAARQFEEGDVQHWWHPPAGRGVRTRITDDLYFLAFVTSQYLSVTGDTGILEERVPFLRAPILKPNQAEDFNLPEVSDQSATLYEHCIRALEYGLKLGPHGIPLMGTGDWNDGMNKVGAQGQGESVWNGWFMLTTLSNFAAVAEARLDTMRAVWCRERANDLRTALEEHAWDGRWYRRAYFDDGMPLGSAMNDECQIDSIVQSWAVISGAADPTRARQCMRAVHQRLVRPTDQLILLFDPPFDKGASEPGYIKGYVPGIRENGGQYTHAATWVVLATALLREREQAMKLFGLLNPIRHADSPEKVARYQVEPYVVAADVYGAPPHNGRGGWTWYTGSAGWLYQICLEAILGFRLRGRQLQIDPCVPTGWPGYEITYRCGTATYHVSVIGTSIAGDRHLTLDGKELPANAINLADDGQWHEVRFMRC